MLEEAQIKKFQELFKKHFHEEITREEAVKRGLKLIRIVQITMEAESKNR